MEAQIKKEQGQVTQQLSVLDDELGRLHDQIGKLEERLISTLRTAPEMKDAEDVQEALVPLADRIRCYATRAEGASTRLLDIVARLEL